MKLTDREEAGLSGLVRTELFRVFGPDPPDNVKIGCDAWRVFGRCDAPKCGWHGPPRRLMAGAIRDAVQHWKRRHMGA